MTGPRVFAAFLAAALFAAAWCDRLFFLPPAPAPDRLPGEMNAQKAVTRASLIRSDSIEIDLNMAGDGVLILSHDPVVDGIPLTAKTAAQWEPRLESFHHFVDEIAASKRRMAYVHLDSKPRDGSAYVAALSRQRRDLEKLASVTDYVFASSGYPWVYAALHRWLLSSGLAAKNVLPLFDYIDFGVDDARRWGLPTPLSTRLLLPVARPVNNAYFRLIRSKVGIVGIMESTVAGWQGPDRLQCWSREETPAPLPARCLKTERARD